MSKRIILVFMAFALAAMACNIPFLSSQPTLDAAALQKAVEQTLAAELAQNPPANPSGGQSGDQGGAIVLPPTATTTNTVQPTLTPTVTTAAPCTNTATFISDVTIADQSELNKSQAFTKTWRIKNVGTCTWSSGYKIVYDHGDQMNGPAENQLTSGLVAPGQEVDVSINMTAPAAVGEYKGYWKFKEPGGVIFGTTTGGSIYVWIKVVDAGAAVPIVPLIPLIPILPLLLPTTLNAPLVAGESGAVFSDGTVIAARNVGDTESNVSSQAFLSFDISSIPAGSTISEAKVDFSGFDFPPGGTDPFPHLGYMFIYPVAYGAVDAGDYMAGYPLGAVVNWGTSASLSSAVGTNDLKNAIQAAVGSSRFKVRAQFRDVATDSDGVADMVRLSSGIKLIIKYFAP